MNIFNNLFKKILVQIIVVSSFSTLVSANNLTVTSTADSGSGTLRELVSISVAGDTIDLSPVTGQTIDLNSTLTIDRNLTIIGHGVQITTTQINTSAPLIDITTGATVNISDIEFSDINNTANSTSVTYVISASTSNPSLNLDNCSFKDNDGILTPVSISSNSSFKIENSSFINNITGSVGALNVVNAPGKVINTTIANNIAGSTAGGIYIYGNTVKVENSTIVNNTANHSSLGSGGIRVINIPNSVLHLKNSILYGNSGFIGNNLETEGVGAVVSFGNNFISSTVGAPNFSTDSGAIGDILNTVTDPLLGTLTKDSDGVTWAYTLIESSTLIDSGSCTAIDTTTITIDQFGNLRNDGSCDIGAIEYIVQPKLTLKAHGGALQFDGATTYIDTNITSSPASFTIEAWVNMSSTGSVNYRPIFGKNVDGTSNETSEFNLEVVDNGTTLTPVFFMGYDVSSAYIQLNVGGTTIPEGQWTHLSASYDDSNGTMVLYINGAQTAIGTLGGARNTVAAPIEIGHYDNTDNQFFRGMMDEVRIWNSARAQSDINTIKNQQLDANESGLIAYYNFDERVGTTVQDIIGNGNDGTIVGDVNRLNFLGDGFEFDGTSSHITMGHSELIDFNNTFTISFWMKGTDGVSDQYLLTKKSSGNSSDKYSLFYGYIDNTVEFFSNQYTGDDPRTGSQIAVDQDKWNHIVYSYDGVNFKGYLNSALVVDQNKSFTLTDTLGGNLYIGASTVNGVDFGNAFGGNLAEIAMWNKTLTQVEIEKIMHSSLKGDESDLAAYWPLNEGVGNVAIDRRPNTTTNDGTITGASWIQTSPTIYGDTIYTTAGIVNYQKLVLENNASIAVYDYNGALPSTIPTLNSSTGEFLYKANTSTDTLDINASDGTTNVNTLFNVYAYPSSSAYISLNLSNVNLAEHNITNIQVIGVDTNGENFIIPDAASLINGENNVSAPVYYPGNNFKVRFDVNNSGIENSYYYNFIDDRLDSELIYTSSGVPEYYETPIEDTNNSFDIDLNASRFFSKLDLHFEFLGSRGFFSTDSPTLESYLDNVLIADSSFNTETQTSRDYNITFGHNSTTQLLRTNLSRSDGYTSYDIKVFEELNATVDIAQDPVNITLAALNITLESETFHKIELLNTSGGYTHYVFDTPEFSGTNLSIPVVVGDYAIKATYIDGTVVKYDPSTSQWVSANAVVSSDLNVPGDYNISVILPTLAPSKPAITFVNPLVTGLLGNNSNYSESFGIAVSSDGTRAYVADENSSTGFLVFDVTSNNPVLLDNSADLSSVYNVKLSPDETKAYVADYNGFMAYDITTDTLVLDGNYSSNVYQLELSSDGQKAYIIANTDSGWAIQVLDINNSTNITELGSYSLDQASYAYSLVLSSDGTKLYVSDDSGIKVFDVASDTPSLFGSIGLSECIDLAISPDDLTLYVTRSTTGVSKLDITNNNPQLLGTYTAVEDAGGITLSSDGTTAYVANSTSGILVLDVTSHVPSFIESIATVGSAYDLAISKDGIKAYVADATGGISVVKIASYIKKHASFTTFDVNMSVADAQNDDLTISVDVNDSSLVSVAPLWSNDVLASEYNGANLVFALNHIGSTIGTVKVTITATDNINPPMSKEFVLEIYNTIPTITSTPITTVNENDVFDVVFNFQNDNGSFGTRTFDSNGSTYGIVDGVPYIYDYTVDGTTITVHISDTIKLYFSNIPATLPTDTSTYPMAITMDKKVDGVSESGFPTNTHWGESVISLKIEQLSMSTNNFLWQYLEDNGSIKAGSDFNQSISIDSNGINIHGEEKFKYLGEVNASRINELYGTDLVNAKVVRLAAIQAEDYILYDDYGVARYPYDSSTTTYTTLEDFVSEGEVNQRPILEFGNYEALVFAPNNSLSYINWATQEVIATDVGAYEIVTHQDENNIGYRVLRITPTLSAYTSIEYPAVVEKDGSLFLSSWRKIGSGGIYHLFDQTGREELISYFENNKYFITNKIAFYKEYLDFNNEFNTLVTKDPSLLIAQTPIYDIEIWNEFENNANIVYINSHYPTSTDLNITIDEDTNKTFVSNDFNFTDVDTGDLLERIYLTSLVSKGSLQLNNIDVTLNQEITVSQIPNLVYSPIANESGEGYATFNFKVNDGEANSTVAYTATINVTSLDDAPTLQEIANTVTLEDTNITIDLNATDIEGNTISYTVDSNDTSIATVSIVNGKVVVTPVANQNKIITVEVNATANGQTATQIFTLDITSVDDTPIINTTLNNISIAEDTNITNYELNVTDIDGDNLILSVDSNDTSILNVIPSWSGFINQATYDYETLDFNITSMPNASGLVRITIIADDGDLNTTRYFDINVTALNDAPTSTDLNITINEDTNKTFITSDFTFSDADAGDLLESIVITSLPTKGTLQLNNVDVTQEQVIPELSIANLVYSPLANENATPYTTFGFKVNDGETNSTVAYTATINVTPVDDAPSISPILDQTSLEDANDFNITLAATDADTDTITYSVASSDTTIANVTLLSDTTLSISQVADANGIVSIEVNATANGVTTTELFDIIITAVDDIPTMKPIPHVYKRVNFTQFTIPLQVEYLDVASATINAIAVPEGIVSVSVIGGVLTIAPIEGAYGVAEILIDIEDTPSILSESFRITVADNFELITNKEAALANTAVFNGTLYSLDSHILSTQRVVQYERMQIVDNVVTDSRTITNIDDRVTVVDNSANIPTNLTFEDISIANTELSTLYSEYATPFTFTSTMSQGQRVYVSYPTAQLSIHNTIYDDNGSAYSSLDAFMVGARFGNTKEGILRNISKDKFLVFDSENIVSASGPLLEVSEDGSVTLSDATYSRITVNAQELLVINTSSGSGYRTDVAFIVDIDSKVKELEYKAAGDIYSYILLNQSAKDELYYAISPNPKVELEVGNDFEYLSLRGSQTLCTSQMQIVLTSMCDQKNTIEEVFGSNVILKNAEEWSYWDDQPGINPALGMNKFTTIHPLEGLVIKADIGTTTILLPYNDDVEAVNDYKGMFSSQWYLVSNQKDQTIAQIEATVSKPIDYILLLRDNEWHIYSSVHDASIGADVPRIEKINRFESFWIRFE